MFAIKSTNPNQNWHWISAVVPTITEAESEIAKIPDTQRQFHRIVEVPCTTFPVFIVEDRDFEFGDIAFVRAKISQLASQLAKTSLLRPSGIVYVLESVYIPEIPGTDEMGRIDHWHVDLTQSGIANFNAWLKNF
jgi:hypothetical protein